MRSQPRFSVVIPAFNAAKTLRSAVRSVLSQSHPAFEIIIVNDGSTDGTPEIAGAFSDPRIRLVTQPNAGLPAARNAGIRAAGGALIAFLDADDLWLPHYLRRMGAALDAHPEAALAYCDAWVFENRTGRVRRTTMFERHRPAGPLPVSPAEFLVDHLRDNFFYVGTTVRASVFDQVGGFREDMTSLEDYELWLRIEASGFHVVEVPEPLALYRASANQMSASTHRMVENLLKLCEILEARPDLSPDARRVLAHRRRATLAVYAPGSARSLGAPVRARVRRVASSIWHTVPGKHVWRKRPPAAVSDVFPDLATR